MLDQIFQRLEPALGADRLRSLHRKRVAVIGCGMIGGQVVPHLGMLQIPMLLVDCDRVEPANLANQGFPMASLGDPKVAARAGQVAALNASCPVRTHFARVEDLGLGVFDGVDLLVGALDGRAARVALRNVSQRLAIPMIDAAVDGSGERLFGTISLYDPRMPESACFGCAFDADGLARIAREGRGPGCPSWRGTDARSTPPTLMASPFGAVVAGHLVVWALRVLLGAGAGLEGRQLQISGDGEARLRTVELPRARRCLFPHEPLAPLARATTPTVGSLLERAHADLGTQPDALRFADRILVLGLACGACGETSPLVRMRHAYADTDLRCRCGSPEPMAPGKLVDRIDVAVARELADVRWSEVGLPAGDLVSAVSPRGEWHYLVFEGVPR